MKKHVFAYLIPLLIAFFFMTPKTHAATQTNITSDINQSTIWTLSNSPYVLQNSITLLPNVQLKIDPGVIIKADNEINFNIQGELTAIGQDDEPIHFDQNVNLNLSSAAPIIFESNIFQNKIIIADGAPQIIKSNLYNTIEISTDDNLDIAQNSFHNTLSCFNSSPNILNNIFNTISDAAYLENCHGNIAYNTIQSAHDGLVAINSDLTIEGNTIQSNGTSIYLASSEANINHNLIQLSDVGIDIEPHSKSVVTDNSFTRNGIAIFNASDEASQINYNDFFANNRPRSLGENYAIFSTSLIELDATHNWWGKPAGPSTVKLPNENHEIINGFIDYSSYLQGWVNYPYQKGDLKFTEIYPNPVIEPSGEWIEIYNSLVLPITLHNLTLCDTYGFDKTANLCLDTKTDTLPDIFIPAKSYIVLASSKPAFEAIHPLLKTDIYYLPDGKIGNGLNNSEETLYLFSNATLLDSLYYKNSPEAKSYALIGDKWLWQDSPTPQVKNPLPVINPPTPPITPTPDTKICHRITASNLSKYSGSCVIIKGLVRNPSGNTFYLLIRGKLYKIYLQSKYHIKKPRLYSGDSLEIKGIVNLYRGKWRILPRSTFDIRIIKRFVKTKKAASSKSKTKLAGYISKSSAATIKSKANPYSVALAKPSISPLTQNSTTIDAAALSPPIVKGASKKAEKPDNVSSYLTYSIFSAIILLLIIILLPRLNHANHKKS